MNPLVVAGRGFGSRPIVGAGKYCGGARTRAAIEASGAGMVTVAVRRLDQNPDRGVGIRWETNTETEREVGLSDRVTLDPDLQAALEATRIFVKEGFTILPYASEDIVFVKLVAESGAADLRAALS